MTQCPRVNKALRRTSGKSSSAVELFEPAIGSPWRHGQRIHIPGHVSGLTHAHLRKVVEGGNMYRKPTVGATMKMRHSHCRTGLQKGSSDTYRMSEKRSPIERLIMTVLAAPTRPNTRPAEAATNVNPTTMMMEKVSRQKQCSSSQPVRSFLTL